MCGKNSSKSGLQKFSLPNLSSVLGTKCSEFGVSSLEAVGEEGTGKWPELFQDRRLGSWKSGFDFSLK